LLLGLGNESEEYWNGQLKNDIIQKFESGLTPEEKLNGHNLKKTVQNINISGKEPDGLLVLLTRIQVYLLLFSSKSS
jgi:translation initiation factor IF-2